MSPQYVYSEAMKMAVMTLRRVAEKSVSDVAYGSNLD